MSTTRGMVSVGGVCYRISKVKGTDTYEVHRILDDKMMGSFTRKPNLRVLENNMEDDTVLKVASEALRTARLSWTGKLVLD